MFGDVIFPELQNTLKIASFRTSLMTMPSFLVCRVTTEKLSFQVSRFFKVVCFIMDLWWIEHATFHPNKSWNWSVFSGLVKSHRRPSEKWIIGKRSNFSLHIFKLFRGRIKWLRMSFATLYCHVIVNQNAHRPIFVKVKF